jgi:phosphopantetheine adenylyltransferase
MPPNKVHPSNIYAVRQRVNSLRTAIPQSQVTYSVRDLIRITKEKVKFTKGYEQTFSKEIFQVVKVIHRMPQPVFELTDLQGRPIKGQFYNYELVKVIVSSETECQIDKIVRTRKKVGIKHLVKWKGSDETFNSWVNSSDTKKNIMDQFYLVLPPGSSAYYFLRNTISNCKTKLAIPVEIEPDKQEAGLVEISYPKGYKKQPLHNTLRLHSMEIKFPLRHYTSLHDNFVMRKKYFNTPDENQQFVRDFRKT